LRTIFPSRCAAGWANFYTAGPTLVSLALVNADVDVDA
jgi:hypothetical protein